MKIHENKNKHTTYEKTNEAINNQEKYKLFNVYF